MTAHGRPRLDRRTLVKHSAAITALAALITRTPPTISAQRRNIPDLVAGNTTFALDLYHQIRQGTDANLLVSPYSVSLALAMTFAGARGDTAAQMADVLALTLRGPDLHETFAALTDDLVARGNVDPDAGEREEGATESGLRIANALWGERTFPFDPAFSDQVKEHHGAGLQQTDFLTAPDAAREDINAWVEDQTEGRIQDIVPEGAITPITRLVLANAIYFYGAWRNAFEEHNTRDDAFHLLDGSTVDVPFMVKTETFEYARTGDMQVIDLPYASDGFSMTIILPGDGRFDAVEASLDPVALDAAIAGLEWTEVRLLLPRFEFDVAASLTDALQSLGMDDAFDPDRADFTGMIDGDPPENLSIGDVLHKAFISVDEEGTEAAAATVVIMVGESAPMEDPPEVRIDRPFLFAIRDHDTGTILFLGRVMNPEG